MAKIDITVDYSKMADKGGIGMVVTIGDALYTKSATIKNHEPETGELFAIQHALRLIPMIADVKKDKVTIYSDQLGYLQCLKKNNMQFDTNAKRYKKRTPINKSVVVQNNILIAKLLEDGYKLELKYTKSHAGNQAHNIADIYASTAAGKEFNGGITPEQRIESHIPRREWVQKYTGQFREQPRTVWDYFKEQVSLLVFNLGVLA